MSAPSLLWFRQDLRLADNPALDAAARGPMLAVFVLEDTAAGPWAHGGAGRWWLHHSLAALDAALRSRGIALHLASGDAARIIPELAARIGAGAVHANRQYEPWARERDKAASAALDGRLQLHTGALLHEPHAIRTQAGTPYGVYSPFARALFARGEPPPPLPAPERLHGPALAGLPLDALGLIRADQPEWWRGFQAEWTPGEAGAQARIARFMARALAGYAEARNLPGQEGTARLSPHLHWGEVSPRQVWHAARAAGAEGEAVFLKEIIWREFSHHLLWHRPEMPETALDPRFRAFPWAPDERLLRAWKAGRTGYPIVDAGMRQMWRTGWMHNRVRMVVASLLVKHLLQPWQAGAACFWDRLVDADLAANSASWQWVAGCGADAAPYFRVFNPTLQGEKFDPAGDYVRRWVPELARVPDRYVHKPWAAPGGPPAGYPAPIVAPERGRERALAAFAALRGAA